MASQSRLYCTLVWPDIAGCIVPRHGLTKLVVLYLSMAWQSRLYCTFVWPDIAGSSCPDMASQSWLYCTLRWPHKAGCTVPWHQWRCSPYQGSCVQRGWWSLCRSILPSRRFPSTMYWKCAILPPIAVRNQRGFYDTEEFFCKITLYGEKSSNKKAFQ